MFYELRRYKINDGRMDDWVEFMEGTIIPFQVSKGMVIAGSFRGEDETTYVWMRRFASEEQRERQYAAVYQSDTWKNDIAPRVAELMQPDIEVTRNRSHAAFGHLVAAAPDPGEVEFSSANSRSASGPGVRSSLPRHNVAQAARSAMQCLGYGLAWSSERVSRSTCAGGNAVPPATRCVVFLAVSLFAGSTRHSG